MAIFTIGYGNRTIEDFIRLLERHQIKYLVDVRSKPYSRFNPEFSQKPLKKAMHANHIGYLFLGDNLGGRPADPTCYTADKRVDYDACETKPFYQQGIARLLKADEGGHVVAIMCSEKKPHECHRSKLIGRTLAKQGIDVQHIDEQDNLVDQTTVIQRYLRQVGADKPHQQALFDQEEDKVSSPLFTSRKPYDPTS